jgi:hypothetical protein
MINADRAEKATADFLCGHAKLHLISVIQNLYFSMWITWIQIVQHHHFCIKYFIE